MVKLEGNEKHIKHAKTRKFYEIRGEILKGRGERIIFTGKIKILSQ